MSQTQGKLSTRVVSRHRSYSTPANLLCSPNVNSKRDTLGDPQYSKFVMLGDMEVGKTSLLKQFISKRYDGDYTPTLEDNYWKIVKGEKHDAQTIELIDTSGNEDYAALTLPHLKKGDAFMLVFGVDDRSSYLKIITYIELLEKAKNKSITNIPVVVVGNKAEDLMHREVEIDEAKKFCKSLNLDYFEVSARENLNIYEAYGHLVCKCRSMQIQRLKSSSNISLTMPLSQSKLLTRRSQSFIQRFDRHSDTVSRLDAKEEINIIPSGPLNEKHAILLPPSPVLTDKQKTVKVDRILKDDILFFENADSITISTVTSPKLGQKWRRILTLFPWRKNNRVMCG